jgi:hypothetical protein
MEPPLHLGDRTPDGQCASEEIDIADLEPDSLRLPKSEDSGDQNTERATDGTAAACLKASREPPPAARPR